MLVVDVNVLVYAHRTESPDHEVFRAWLHAARSTDEPLGLSPVVASGFLRLVTHPRVFREPTPTALALAFVAGLWASPAVRRIESTERHWSIFEGLCLSLDGRGNHVPDLFLAALAIERRATLVTVDRGFARVPDLRLLHPADEGRRRVGRPGTADGGR